MSNDEAKPEKKKKRPKGLAEPALGFGRDLEIRIQNPVPRLAAASVLVGAIAFASYWVASTRDHDDGRAALMQLCGAFLGAASLWLFAVAFRHRDRDDLVLRLTDRTIDRPMFTLLGPTRIVSELRDMGPAAMMTGRNGLWIEAQPFVGARIVLPAQWFPPETPVNEVYWRFALRIALARRTRGEVDRAALVGSEAMVALGTREAPVTGVVISRPRSKKPIVVATVDSIPEFFRRMAEFPDDAKLVVPDDVRAAMLDAISDPSRLV